MFGSQKKLRFRDRFAFRPTLEVLEGRCLPSTFTVTNLLDGPAVAPPPGSLRAMIQKADNHSGLDTIVFQPGLEGTIVLNGGNQIDIVDSLTLIGPGAAKIAVDGNGMSRIFQVTGPKVTIRGRELRNGRSTCGGAVYGNKNLTLVQDIFDDNQAASGGGAIGFQGSFLTIQQCTLSGNSAGEDGGGLWTDSSVTGLTVVN